MKQLFSTLLLAASTLVASAGPIGSQDSIYVKPYRAGNALRMSYSIDKHHWTPVGTNFNLLSSDFGSWGSEKKMASEPSVLRDKDGEWYAVWAVNGKVNQFATTHTKRLNVWVPQDYPYTSTKDENVIDPVLTKQGNTFIVTYKTSQGNTYAVSSQDFIHWSEAKKVSAAPIYNNIIRCTWQEVDALITNAEAAGYRASRDNGGFGNDGNEFGKIKDLKTTVKADLSQSKAISPELFGIFFEDINYAADGGLYAELLQNRDFEYHNKERGEWNHTTAWDIVGTKNDNDFSCTVSNDNPLHQNNSYYAVLKTTAVGGKIINKGWDGIPVKKGEKYDFSAFLRTEGKAAQRLRVSVIDGEKVIAQTVITANKPSWTQVKTVLTAGADCANAQLSIEPLTVGTVNLDFTSLFPQKTFKNRKNGMRPDLAQALADIKPKFVRFPGGCASHGNGINNIYHWQATVGPMWERQHDRNIWGYHQSRGLGFYEYFQFCEDIGATPLPVLAGGVPCQNSWQGGNGQQGGIPWERDLKALAEKEGKTIDEVAPYKYMGKALTMESYLQELLDLIEWANGDAKASTLAKLRADAGHKAPFGLKYLGIGNEDLISQVFLERYLWLIKEVKKAHPEITVVGTVGPFWEGSDYETGWEIARKENIEVVDEHYYNSVGWYLNHQDFYDKYPRTGTKVYLGEWASKGNRWENALAEAIHITNVERNADVVVMSSYAPLLAREGHTQWNPDLIYFNNTEVKPTPNYYVQALCGQNAGSEYIFSETTVSDNAAQKRVTSSIVRAENGDIIIKLVNALPTANAVTLDLGDISAYKATLTQLATDAKERNISAPKSETITTEALQALTLPAYSFSIIRLSK